MRVALVGGYKNGAIDQVMQTLKEAVAPLGVEADIVNAYTKGFDKNFADYDLVHLGYSRYWDFIDHHYFFTPCTANIWHVGNGNEQKYRDIEKSGIAKLVVDDVMTLQQLGQEGITNVVKIPLPIDTTKWHHLPPPEGRFKVGVFCNNYPYKRWQIVVQAAKKAGVKCLAYVMPQDRSEYNLEPIKDVYPNVHVLASATFVDTNSLPLREALLCGRPAISTQNDGMGRVLKDGVNGYWFDGSVVDLAAKLRLCEENYEALVAGTKATKFESLKDISASYVKLWSDTVESAE